MHNKPYKTGNPALNEKIFEDSQQGLSSGETTSALVSEDGAMTLAGTVNKCYLLLGTTVAAGAVTWHYAFASPNGTAAVLPWVLTGSVIGFILALVIIFKRRTAPVLSLFYAIFEGLFLGGLSAHYESAYPGIVMQGVGLTACIFLSLLLAYSSRLVQPTENFKLGVVAATGGIVLLYLFNWITTAFFHLPVPFLHDSGWLGIGVSIVITIVAALNLVLDFDFIEQGVQARAPKYMEWYGAFGLLVTLVWLYLEILRLIGKARN